MTTAGRVAIVAVHGIADQRAGQTVREVARLLCHGGDGEPRYVQGEIHELLVPVEKLDPGGEIEDKSGTRSGPATKEPSRNRPGAPSGFFTDQQAKAAPAPEAKDLGLAMNDYLLGRLHLSEADELYESSRVSLKRRADGRQVDVHEMYWADLSRLGEGGIKALTSLYQLFFHLNTLGAGIVDQVALSAQSHFGWRLLQRLHAWLAWLMKVPMALLQLCMLMLVLFGAIGLASSPEGQGRMLAALFGVGGIVLAALGLMGWLKAKAPHARAALLVLCGALSIASFALAVFSLNTEIWLHYLYFGAAALVAALAGAWMIERYSGVAHGVRLPGHLLVACTAIGLCVAGDFLLQQVTAQFEWMIAAALNVGEFLIAGALLVWAVFVLVQIVALLLGLWLGQAVDEAGKASLQTARIALVGSTALFAVLSLVLWSVISYVAGHSKAMNEVMYTPLVFGEGYRSAAIFVEARIESLGAFFTPLVAAFILVLLAVALVLLPSLVEEIKPTTNLDRKGLRPGVAEWSSRLGAWLGRGIRWLDLGAKYLIPPAAIIGSLLYLAFIVRLFASESIFAGGAVEAVSDFLEYFRGEALVDAGKWLAGGALTIAALGTRFTKTFGRLRVAIDAVLDIDNYFADPPNGQPPRARIFSRYASLLRHLRKLDYERIVIVAHSQGTVISADLLRYLHVQGRLGDVVGKIPVSLITVGSPLRDLYAQRFPLLYRWMGSDDGGFAIATPNAADIGAVEWVNACRSGDYVGRFLWTPPAQADRFRVASIAAGGRVEASRSADRAEFCLGAGAHTHYFSNDAVALAVEMDRLITA
ncbi:MAG TPA: hypothetical protein VHB46_11030 [Burkholderiales bacterium]|nr:hypothetical protein [Burkholderiales bacterium]